MRVPRGGAIALCRRRHDTFMDDWRRNDAALERGEALDSCLERGA
jgi:hypothetical protein